MKKFVQNIFDNYTDKSCYWAGLLASDGCIDINNTIRLELNSNDSYLIEQFKEDCKAEHDISYRESTDAYSIRFSDKSIKDSLESNFSVTTDKTYNLQLPLLTLEQYKHYLRGFFDGDGCLTEFFTNRPTASFRVYLTSGSYSFLVDTSEMLKNNGIIKGGSICKKAANCWHLQLAINDSSGFLNFIYNDNNISNYRYMSRKYMKYCKLIINKDRSTKEIKV